MMTYDYTLEELRALGVTGISITYASLEIDRAQLRVPMQRADVPAVPWAEGDRLVISDERSKGRPRLFAGRVKKLHTSLSGVELVLEVELANDVDVLDTTTYAYVGEEGFPTYAQSFYLPRAAGESRNGERLSSVRDVCESCFDWAHMTCSREVDFDATIMGVAGTGSQSCWSLILSALRWVPDAATAMRYSAEGDVLVFSTARRMPNLTLQARGGVVQDAEGKELGSFEHVVQCELSPRPDLVPPCCALTGRRRLVLPAGGDVRAPGAFVYHVRERESRASEAKKAATAAVLRMAPRQEVHGRLAPVEPAEAMNTQQNRREPCSQAPGEVAAWWQGFAPFALLRKLGAENLVFGRAYFEPVPAADAYPPQAEDAAEDGSLADGATSLDPTAGQDEAPANYEENPQEWEKLYLFDKGAFPASAKAKNNLSGLKWCKGKLCQYVWPASGAELPEGVSKEAVLDFFDGATRVNTGGQMKTRRYTMLEVEGIWINRRSLHYREGTNELEGDNNQTDEEEEDDEEQDPDYEAALRTFYEATRKLCYDGSVTLSGVSGNPGAWLACGINVSGLLPEWESMATPCNSVSYDPIARRATLTLGSRENLTMEELLERQRIGIQQAESRRNGNTRNEQDTTPDDSSDDETSDEESDVEMIAPSISASHSAGKGAHPLNPFEVYAEGKKWMLNGGFVRSPGGLLTAEPVDISQYYVPGRVFSAYPKRLQDGSWVVRYRYTDTTSDSEDAESASEATQES